jgi:hypothetical protein
MALEDNALTTLATLKDELGIVGATQDTTLERMINSVSAAIESYCNRKFWYEADIAEKVAGYGTKYLHVSRNPIVSISSITFDGATVGSDNYEIHDANGGSLYSLGEWTWTTDSAPNLSSDPLPGNEQKLYEVTYTGGWVTPHLAGVLTRNLPYDLEDACVMMCTSRYRWKGRDPSVKSERLMEGSQTFAATSGATGTDPMQASLPGVWTILQRYRRYPIGG